MLILKALCKPEHTKIVRFIVYSLLTISIASSIFIIFSADRLISKENGPRESVLLPNKVIENSNQSVANTSQTDQTAIQDQISEAKESKVKTNSNRNSSRFVAVNGSSISDTNVNQPENSDSPTEPNSSPPEAPSATVAFYADNQSDSDIEDENHRKVLQNILATGANPLFHAGDLMEDGTQASLDRFNNIASTMLASRTFYGALGNNDRKVGDSSVPSPLYLGNFTFPGNEQWYSVNVGNLHLVVLDSAFSSGSATQLSWLQSDLQSNASQSRITGVMFHHPAFASSIRQYLVDNGVDFVISGHNHSYTHTIDQGVHYFVTTGQPNLGYLFLQVYSNKANLYAYNSNNSLMESVVLNNR